VFGSVYTAILALLGFSFLVLIHELGHFLAAKWVGVRVEAFSLGFGPYLGRKWGDTQYRLSLIPLGGYVKMAGEEPEPGHKPAPDEFYGKTVGQRAFVFSAGVFMNIVFGYLIFIAAYRVGVPVMPAVVGDVLPGSPAWRAGLQRGDVIESIDNISPPTDFEDLRVAIMLSGRGESVKLGISRNGRELTKTIYPEYDPELGAPQAGILPKTSMTVAEAPRSYEEAPSEGEPDLGAIFRAGLKEGDVITSLKLAEDETARPVTEPGELAEILDNCAGNPVEIGFTRDGVAQPPVTVRPRRGEGRARIGVWFGSNEIREVRADSWAHLAGLREKDVILSVNGEATPTQDRAFAALDAAKDEPATAKVRRAGKEIKIAVGPHPAIASAASDILFAPGATVTRLVADYPAARAGMQPGDRIIAVNGTDVASAADVQEALQAAEDGDVEIAWLRGQEKISATLSRQKPWEISIPLEAPREIVKAGLAGSMRLGTRKATQWIYRIYATLRRLLSGRISGQNLHGFIGIGVITFTAARLGFGFFLYVLGILSVNLGVVNLLPIPVFDGGHLMFALIEKIRGKAVNERIRAAAGYIGLALIIALVCLTFWNDIRTFVFRW